MFLWDIRERQRRDLKGLRSSGELLIEGFSTDGETLFVTEGTPFVGDLEFDSKLLVFDTVSGNRTYELHLGQDDKVVGLDANRSLAAIATYDMSREQFGFEGVSQLTMWNYSSGEQDGLPLSLDSIEAAFGYSVSVSVVINPSRDKHAFTLYNDDDGWTGPRQQRVAMLWDTATGRLTDLAGTG